MRSRPRVIALLADGLPLDLRHALDPVAFARERLGVDPDPLQASLLRSRAHRSLLNCCRQWGKSTMAGVGALHEGTYSAHSKTVVLSPTQRQSSLLLATVAELAERARVAARPLKGEDPGLELPSGVVVALPGSEATTRGFARVTWLIVDEAARVPDALWRSAQAYLATTDGRISLMSTPFGKRGFYHEEASRPGRWEITRVTAAECPRISAAFLEEQRATLPASWFAQEYCCEFVEVEESMFTHGLVLGAMRADVEELVL